MSGWAEFAVAFGVFLASHMIPTRPRLRAALVARLGPAGFGIVYSVLSTALLVWLIGAAMRAPYVQILPPWPALRWAAWIAMAPACLLIVAGMRVQNPFSFGGFGRVPFDPARPGVLATTRHPLLAGLALWAGGHLLANGDLAFVILFGVFTGFALMGMVMIDRRKARLLTDWPDLARCTRRLSLRLWRPDVPTIVLALLVYAGLVWLHPILIGVSPLP